MTDGVVIIDPVSDPRWDRLVRSRRADVFHTAAWLAVLSDVYGFQLRGRLLLTGGEVQAGLVYAKVDDELGRRVVSLPFSDFCDPLVDGAEQWRRLSEGLFDHPVRFRCLHRTEPLDDPRLSPAGKAHWHRIAVDLPEEELWARLDPGARRAIRKAANQGVEVRVADHPDDLRRFFELHLKVRKHKYRLLAQPYRFFEAIWERFLATGDGALVLAEVEGSVVGGVMFLSFGDTLYYKFNASDLDRLDIRPNDTIMWHGMRLARDRGLAFVDLGVSDWDQEGLIRYKEKYATDHGVVTTLVGGPAPGSEVTRFRGMLPSLTTLLTEADVPDFVTERAGDLYYRLFT